MIHRTNATNSHQRLVLAAMHCLRLIEAMIYLGSFTMYSADDWSAKLIFSDWAEGR